MADEDEDRRAILARRQRFVGLAMAGLVGAAGAAGAQACADETGPRAPTPIDAGPIPGPCLTAPLEDGGFDAGPDDAGTIVIRDAGPDDAG